MFASRFLFLFFFSFLNFFYVLVVVFVYSSFSVPIIQFYRILCVLSPLCSKSSEYTSYNQLWEIHFENKLKKSLLLCFQHTCLFLPCIFVVGLCFLFLSISLSLLLSCFAHSHNFPRSFLENFTLVCFSF